MTSDGDNTPRSGKAVPRFHSRHRGGNTFIPFDLEPQVYKDMPLAELVDEILKRLAGFTSTRRDYYDTRRAASTEWVFRCRAFLAAARASAFLLTAAAAALQLESNFAAWSRGALTSH